MMSYYRPDPAKYIPNGGPEDHWLVIDGNDLKPEEVDTLNERIRKAPNDLKSRLYLIGFHERKYDKTGRDSLFRDVVWLIENHPSNYVLRYFGGEKFRGSRAAALRKLWLNTIKEHPKDPYVLGNAAMFFRGTDVNRSVALVQRAQALGCTDAYFPRRIAIHYRYMVMNGAPSAKKSYAQQAFKWAENTLAIEEHRGERIGLLMDMATVAIEVGDWKKARRFASELLRRTAYSAFTLWSCSAHLFLARIDFHESKSRSCKLRLAKVLSVIRSERPTHLVSSNRMTGLLNDLLQADERDIVIEALKVCLKKCEEDKRGQIEKWLRFVKHGKKPKLIWKTAWR